MTEQQQECPIRGAAFTSVNISSNWPNHHLAVILGASVQTTELPWVQRPELTVSYRNCYSVAEQPIRTI